MSAKKRAPDGGEPVTGFLSGLTELLEKDIAISCNNGIVEIRCRLQ